MSARTSKASPTTRLTGYRPASSSGRTHSITRDAGERGVVTLVERRRLVVEAISEFGNARSRQRTREGKDRRIPAAATGVAFARRRPSAGHHGNEEYHEMRGILVRRYGGAEVLEHGELPDPVPGAGEVLIRVRVAGVNFTDV